MEAKEKNKTRFKLFIILAISLLAVIFSIGQIALSYYDDLDMKSRYEGRSWYYKLEEMEPVYYKEYNDEEKLLQNIIYKKDGKWIGTFDGKEFIVPQEFIDKTLDIFKAMLEQKTAKYLFRLDAFHGHPFIEDSKHYRKKYFDLNAVDQTSAMVHDSKLGILFHNTEHLLVDPDNAEAVALNDKRNVLGWYDGRSIEILPLPSADGGNKRTAHSSPGHDLCPYLRFGAHKDGNFSIEVGGKEIRIDISFDDDTYY